MGSLQRKDSQLAYKLLSCEISGQPRGGILVGETVYLLSDVLQGEGQKSVLETLAQWDVNQPLLEARSQAIASGSLDIAGIALRDVRLLAPVLYPGAIYCAGANYNDHVGEMYSVMGIEQGLPMKEAGELPWHYIKPARSTVVGPGTAVRLPIYSQKVDWEVELVAVIGRAARNVSIADALDYVAGYTIANDLSARDATRRHGNPVDSPFHWDRISSKCFEGACPLGPWIVPASDFDSADAALRLWVNDELMQDSSTRHMIFNTAEQIAMLSSRMTLHPGDIILTGSPSGVGMGRGIFLKPGDRVRLAIEGIGEMSHSLV